MAVVIIITSLLSAAGLKLYTVQLQKDKQDQLEQSFRNIQAALTGYLDENGYYPCPAPQNAAPNTAEYGRSTNCNDTSIAAGACEGGVCIAKQYGARVRIGALPIKDLNLSTDEYGDPYGHEITYAVTEHLAVSTAAFDNKGAINVIDANNNTVLSSPGTAQFTLVSHGKDGAGAYTVEGVANPEACDTGTEDNENCNNDATFRSADFSVSGASTRFDDQIRYSLQFGQLNVACPDGEVMTEIRNKEPVCKTLQSLSCADGEALVGFDAAGTPKCISYQNVISNVIGNFNCPSGQMVSGFTADSQPVCAKPPASTNTTTTTTANASCGSVPHGGHATCDCGGYMLCNNGILISQGCDNSSCHGD